MTDHVEKIHPTLPVFKITRGEARVLYTPGLSTAVEPGVADLIREGWRGRGGPLGDDLAGRTAARLETMARRAVAAWGRKLDAPYQPECLTIYLSNYCNLGCRYCFASDGSDRRGDGASGARPVVSEKAVRDAARLVAGNSARKKKGFFLALHGGGEPTLHWDLVKRLEKTTREAAHEFGVEWFGFIATNGVISEKKAHRLAGRFNLVGLSCDGPPRVQDRQRPRADGGKSSSFVQRTARAIAGAGGRFEVRATITPQTMTRQAEILTWLHERLGASRVRFEPVYRQGGRETAGFTPDQSDAFVSHFLAAQRKAGELGCDLSFSGVRLNDLHGPYCDVSRDVLHLTPDGAASACFFCIDPRTPGDEMYEIGRHDASRGEFPLNQERIASHRRAAARVPDACENCINIFHCARGCPELCWAAGASGQLASNPAALFRCRVQKQLATRWILEAAGADAPPKRPPAAGASPGAKTGQRSVETFLRNAPAGVDAPAIIQQWEAVKSVYGLEGVERRRMPSPIWAERGYTHDGPRAWRHATEHASRADQTAPMSIYIHIPFCDQRCGFCDCYAMPLGRNKAKKDEKYASALIREMDAWAEATPLARRPVTTVHFGGGTPNCLEPSLFERIVRQCRRCFNITPGTELAIESTGALIAGERLSHLRRLGFTRLHVGVQTLEEPLRHLIGRRETAAALLNRMVAAVDSGFITSADVIYGLPGQTMTGLLSTLDSLVEAGLHGVSAYRLNLSRRNQRLLERFKDFKRDALRDYTLYQAADQYLSRAGYRKNHFVHFARPEDRNLYYTHLRRGEDLLALGATADGVFGPYHYRHPGYVGYVTRGESGRPALEGGVAETERDRAYGPATTALMCGGVRPSDLNQPGMGRLPARWMACALIRKSADPDYFPLTANGSWFLNEMISELQE